MRKLLTSFALAMLSLTAFALPDYIPNGHRWDHGSITNLPAIITASATSNINAVIFTRPGKPIALFPSTISTSSSNSNIVFDVVYAVDHTLTNWTTTVTTVTNVSNGATNATGRVVIPAADAGSVGAIKILRERSLDSANTTTNQGFTWSQEEF